MLNLLVSLILPVAALIALVLWILRVRRNAPPKDSAHYDLATGSGVWFAQVREPGWQLMTLGSMTRNWGQLRVQDGQVSFTPDGASTPAWTAPANQMVVERPARLATAFHAAVPRVGQILIEPSTSRMARWRSAGSWAGSDLRTTQDVVTILQGWGAAAR